MDVRAFGSVYGQQATLPYASGCGLTITGSHNFPATRAVYVNDSTSNKSLQVIFADGSKQPVTLQNISPNTLFPFSIVTISGAATTVSGVVLLY
jgi:hypothetical protein